MEQIATTDSPSTDDGAPFTRSSPRLSVHAKERKMFHVLSATGLSPQDDLDHFPQVRQTLNFHGSTGNSLEDISGTGTVLRASHYWEQGYDPSTIDGKLHRVRRYLRSARSLYEIQMQPKRPSADLKMKTTPYGFKSGSTHDALATFVSPVRLPQVLDAWTPLEIGIFEDAFDRYNKDFHAIAQQLPRKTVQDVIAFYYIWKKHGVLSFRHIDGEESDGGSSDGDYDASMSAETLKIVEKLKRRRRSMKDYFAAARELNCVNRINQVSHRDVSLSEFSLHRLAGLRPAIPATSDLRNASVLDTWTPHEIRVFELAMECYGKEEFHQVARMIGTKSCKEVIALYYVWKKDPYYKVIKSRWEKRDPFSKKKSTPSTAGTTTTTSGAPSTTA